jgi:hypothetical protein
VEGRSSRHIRVVELHQANWVESCVRTRRFVAGSPLRVGGSRRNYSNVGLLLFEVGCVELGSGICLPHSVFHLQTASLECL